MFSKASALVALVLMVGCSQELAESDTSVSPDVELDSIEGQQTIYNGSWSLSAHNIGTGGRLQVASFTLTGPAGSTTAAGSCGISKWVDSSGNPKLCSTTGDCSSNPTSLPSGGSRYCVAPQGSGNKYCYYRPGAASAYCGGTPKTGAPVGPNTYNSSIFSLTSGSYYNTGSYDRYTWNNIGCFAGCASIAGSIASDSVFDY